MRGRNWGMVALSGVVYAGMTVGGVLWVVARDGRTAFWDLIAQDLWSSVGLGIGFATAVLWYSAYASAKQAWAKTLESEFGLALGGLSVVQCVALALASAVGEEFFFRAALQPTLIRASAKVLTHPAAANLLGVTLMSLAFGACHFPFRKNLVPWTLFTIVTAYGFGGIFLWTGNLVGPILAHALINGINLSRIARKGASPVGPVITMHTRKGALEFGKE